MIRFLFLAPAPGLAAVQVKEVGKFQGEGEHNPMLLPDFETQESFSFQEMEHILQLPPTELVELLGEVRRTHEGRLLGEDCRLLVRKLRRGRLFSDLIARRAVNAVPEIQRGPESGHDQPFLLLDVTNQVEFEVRFSGDLRNYLDSVGRSLSQPCP